MRATRTWLLITCVVLSASCRETAASETVAVAAEDPWLIGEGSVSVRVAPGGAHIVVGGHEGTLTAVALGRPGARRALEASARAERTGSEVRAARGVGVTEWWRSLATGLEHGVTIAEQPEGEGEIAVVITLIGALSAHLVSDDAIELRVASGERVGGYTGLVVLDATGARLPSHMSMEGPRIVLAFDDTRAVYPVVVDPLLTAQEARLSAAGGGSDNFGARVAFSSDGDRALVGASVASVGGVRPGNARVFVRTGTTWAQEAILLASGGGDGDAFGFSVALSADGSYALVGAYNAMVGGLRRGSARVFVRTATTWTEQAALLAPAGDAGDSFGYSVALSADGRYALVAASQDTTIRGQAGSAHVFVRTGAAWAHEAMLVASDAAVQDQMGFSAALSGDGSVALLGVARDDTTSGGTDAGTARVFVRAGSTWTEEATLAQPDGMSGDSFGLAVDLSDDGSRALVGAPADSTASGLAAGSAHLYLRTGSSWAREAAFVASTGASDDRFGIAVGLSGDGLRALVGAQQDDLGALSNAGSANLFVRSGTTWTEEARLLAPDAAASDNFGCSVALAFDGARALIGAVGDDGYLGSARVFTVVASPDGTPCSRADTCASAFCVDGFCCASSCGGGAADCQVCSAALGSTANGTCGLLGSGTTCRAAGGVCDIAESCTGAAAACPADAFVGPASVCRGATDVCDAFETCTGTGAACPSDVRVSAGTSCRDALGPCDRVETCDGASVACPGDTLASAGSVCRGTVGGCDIAEVCGGASVACPGDVLAPAGVVCLAATPGNACDLVDVCTGASGACAPMFAPADTVCGTATTEVCDVPDHCAGTSADCVAEYASGVECRAADGACDVGEVCSGSSATCPPDGALAAAITCRASTSLCDPAETCDGVGTTCPGDVTTCADDGGAGDGGAGDGGARDGGVTVDASPGASDAGAAAPSTGCGCRASAAHAPERRLSALFALGGALAFRRRRRPPARRRAS